MDAETLEALKGSIAKWEAIVAGTGKDNGASNCPLCKLFNKEETGDETEGESACEGCPVRAVSGKDWCEGTPYHQYVDARWRQASVDDEWTKKMAVHAQSELDFLKSLLPSPDKSME